jgi:hypothetical protein
LEVRHAKIAKIARIARGLAAYDHPQGGKSSLALLLIFN